MFRGSIVALITPMRASGEVDWPALERLIGWHLDSGTHGIVPMGTTGESATLDITEHLEVIRRTVSVVAGQIPVIAGTGANATSEAIHQTLEAEKSGADACLLVTPYYNRPTQAGLIAHYEAVARVANGPLILYNVPPRTGCDMKAETVAQLAKIDNIVGIKEACNDVNRTSQILELSPKGFFVLSGEDALTLQLMRRGAVGAISVTANVVPDRMAAFCEAALAEDWTRADELDAELQPLHEFLFIESSPTPTKWALYEMGRIDSGIRLPLLPLSEIHRPELRRRLQLLGAL